MVFKDGFDPHPSTCVCKFGKHHLRIADRSFCSQAETPSSQILAEEMFSFVSHAFSPRRPVLQGLFLTNIVIRTNETTPVFSTVKSILLCA